MNSDAIKLLLGGLAVAIACAVLVWGVVWLASL